MTQDDATLMKKHDALESLFPESDQFDLFPMLEDFVEECSLRLMNFHTIRATKLLLEYHMNHLRVGRYMGIYHSGDDEGAVIIRHHFVESTGLITGLYIY